MAFCHIRDHICCIVVTCITLLSLICGVLLIWNSSCSLIWFSSNNPGKITCASGEDETTSSIVHQQQLERAGQSTIGFDQVTTVAERVSMEKVINKGAKSEAASEAMGKATFAGPDEDVFHEKHPSRGDGGQRIFLALAGLVMILFSLLSCSCLIRFSSREYANYQKSRQSFSSSGHIEVIMKHSMVQPVTDDSPDHSVKCLLEVPWQYEKQLGRDCRGLQHKGITVRNMYRVDNEKLMKEYSKKAEATVISPYPDELCKRPISTTRTTVGNYSSSQNNNGSCSRYDSAVDLRGPERGSPDGSTDIWINMDHAASGDNHLEHTGLLADCQKNLKPGEVFLFHGTKLENIPSILESGFDLGRARTGLYGQAIYLAESPEKADQYADYPSNRRETDLAMLVVRVKLGRMLIHMEEKKVKMPHKGFLPGGKPKYETVVAGHDKRFREFLAFNQKLLYPEFVVIYDRVQ